MAAATKTKPDENAPGVTPAPTGTATTGAVAASAVADDGAPAAYTYLALIDSGGDGGNPLWEELGWVTATTKPDAWAKATTLWPQLIPDAPTSPEDPVSTVRAKLIPKRYAGTIDSTVEYVPPRAVTKGI